MMQSIHGILASSFASQSAVISTYLFLVSTMASIGLRVTLDEVLSALGNRRLMARVMLANIIAVPILGMVLVKIFVLSTDAQSAILLLALAPGGVQAIQFTTKVKGGMALAAALIFLLSLVGIIVSPFLADLVLPVETRVTMPYLHVMEYLVLLLLLPMLAGFALRNRAGNIARGLDKPMLLISNISFVATIALTLAVRGKATRSIGWAALTAMVLLILFSMVIGWWLGGPETGARQVSAVATSMRNAGVCLLIAVTSFPGSTVATTVVAFMALMVPPNMLFTLYHGVRNKRRAG